MCGMNEILSLAAPRVPQRPCAVCRRCGKCGSGADILVTGRRVLPAGDRDGTGLAVDLGTTTVVLRRFDLRTGRETGRRGFLNPQRRFAADVMGRITAAMDGHLDELADAINGALGAFDADETVICGNTTMQYLLCSRSPAGYAVSPFRADCLFGETVDLPGGRAYLPRCAHAFVGGDITCAVLACDLCAGTGPELLADVGTNGELALWKDGHLFVTSTAAGPAFEKPGVKGSDLVAAIADHLDGASLPEGITPADIAAVQLAKAAVAAGIATLLEATGTRAEDVMRFHLAGGFGTGLDIAKAVRIGLIPAALAPRTVVDGNAAIEGAALMLLRPEFRDSSAALADRAEHVELGGNPAFDDRFIECLSFDSISN